MKAPNIFVEMLLNRQLEPAKKLLSSGTNINAGYGSKKWTALHYAVENLAGETTRWLLENGADPNQKDSTGWTPLHLAVDAETDRAKQEYVEKGVVPPAAELAMLLLRHGADPNAKTNKGQTALELARSGENFEAVEVLKQYGASDVAQP